MRCRSKKYKRPKGGAFIIFINKKLNCTWQCINAFQNASLHKVGSKFVATCYQALSIFLLFKKNIVVVDVSFIHSSHLSQNMCTAMWPCPSRVATNLTAVVATQTFTSPTPSSSPTEPLFPHLPQVGCGSPPDAMCGWVPLRQLLCQWTCPFL